LQLAIPESPEIRARNERRAAIRAALAERGTRVVVTPALIAANVAMFLVVAAHAPTIFNLDADTLLRWGASYGPDVTHGAWWRLMTAVFLHGGVLHLVSNMFALMIIGSMTERLLGSVAFTVVYALAGLGGSIASEWWHPVTIGVGASGAIFGLYGGLFAFLLRRHTTLPRGVVKSLASAAAVVVVYNIAAGLTQAQIDNAGHVGGLVAGFFAGLAVTATGDAANVTAPLWRSLTVACAGLAITAAGVTALPRYGDLRRNLSQFSSLDGSTLSAGQRSLDQLAGGDLTEDDAVVVIERLLASWRAQRSALATLQVPSSDQLLVTRIVEYMGARERGWELMAEAIRKRDVTLFQKSQAAHIGARLRMPGGGSGGRRVVRVAETPRTAAIAIGSPALSAELRRAETLEKTSVNLYNSQLAKARAGRISLPELAASIEKEIAVPWEQQYERMRALDLHGPADWTRKPVAEFMRRRLDAWRLTARAARERNPLLMKQAVAAQQDAIATLHDTTTTASATRDGKMGNQQPKPGP
jgi:rhomboid protease GluP